MNPLRPRAIGEVRASWIVRLRCQIRASDSKTLEPAKYTGGQGTPPPGSRVRLPLGGGRKGEWKEAGSGSARSPTGKRNLFGPVRLQVGAEGFAKIFDGLGHLVRYRLGGDSQDLSGFPVGHPVRSNQKEDLASAFGKGIHRTLHDLQQLGLAHLSMGGGAGVPFRPSEAPQPPLKVASTPLLVESQVAGNPEEDGAKRLVLSPRGPLAPKANKGFLDDVLSLVLGLHEADGVLNQVDPVPLDECPEGGFVARLQLQHEPRLVPTEGGGEIDLRTRLPVIHGTAQSSGEGS
jgi:hypothetical protein